MRDSTTRYKRDFSAQQATYSAGLTATISTATGRCTWLARCLKTDPESPLANLAFPPKLVCRWRMLQCRIQNSCFKSHDPARVSHIKRLRLPRLDSTRVHILVEASMELSGGIVRRFQLAADFDLWLRFSEYAELHLCEVPLSGFPLDPTNGSWLVLKNIC